jgi:hypothetical protein
MCLRRNSFWMGRNSCRRPGGWLCRRYMRRCCRFYWNRWCNGSGLRDNDSGSSRLRCDWSWSGRHRGSGLGYNRYVRGSDDSRSGRSRNHGRLHASCFGCGFFRGLFGYGSFFGCGFRIGRIAEMLAHLFGGVDFNRARMRLFFCDAGFGQKVDDRFRLNLEFARQLVDADLIQIGHCPPGLLLATLFRRSRGRG